MNPTLRAAQDKLTALQTEADGLLAKGELTETESTRAAALATEIPAQQKSIESLVALAGLNDASKAFLTGSGTLQSVTSGLQVNDTKSVKIKSRSRCKNLMSIPGMQLEDARQTAYNLAMWMSATFKGSEKARKYCQENNLPVGVMFTPEMAGGQSEGVNEDGGFLVPIEIDDVLIDLREMYGVFRRRARNSTMNSDQKLRNRRKSGLPAAWLSEGGELDVSKKGWDQVKLGAKTLGCLAKWTNEWGADAMIEAADDLAREMSWTFAKEEDEAGFVGTGVSTNGGIVGITQKLLDLYGTGGGVGLILATDNLFEELDMADFQKMVGALPEYADTPNVAWYCHRVFYATVMLRLMIASGGVTAAEVASGAAFKNRTFLGYPVEVTQVMPKTDANSQVPCFFGDLALASDFGDRQQTSIATSEHVFFSSNEMAIRGIERVDINNHDVGSATEAGPIVGLLTASG